MRIISGKWKGRPIISPSEGTRPSTDRTRQALFSILQNVIEEATILDLYSGSGALALESLSRGAVSALSVESDRTACHVIKKNTQSLKCDNLSIIQRPVLDYLKSPKPYVPFSLIFADPPYEKEFLGSELQQVLSDTRLLPFLTPDALFIAESPNRLSPVEQDQIPSYWNLLSQRKYGKSHITILQRTSV